MTLMLFFASVYSFNFPSATQTSKSHGVALACLFVERFLVASLEDFTFGAGQSISSHYHFTCSSVVSAMCRDVMLLFCSVNRQPTHESATEPSSALGERGIR